MSVKWWRTRHAGISEDKLEHVSLSHCFLASKVGDLQDKLMPFIVVWTPGPGLRAAEAGDPVGAEGAAEAWLLLHAHRTHRQIIMSGGDRSCVWPCTDLQSIDGPVSVLPSKSCVTFSWAFTNPGP